mgnify:CR=1 FL=1
MEKFTYTLSKFDGYSEIRNKRDTMASDISNFEVRETSLRTRKGSKAVLPATPGSLGSFMLFKTKLGVKHFLGAEGANILKVNFGLGDWSWFAAPLRSNCANPSFDKVSYMNKLYMGNGVDRIVYDGVSITDMPGSPKFNVIETYKNRLWCNHLPDPTIAYYNDFDNNGIPTDLTMDCYMQVSENAGDPIKGMIRLLTHMVFINEFSTYALYGSSADDFQKVYIGPIGAVNRRVISSVNEVIYWLSHDGVYSYGGSSIYPVSFGLGRLGDAVNVNKLRDACAIGYNNYYWLAIAGPNSTSNDTVLLFDTITQRWNKFIFPFSINDFCLDGDALYCAASDNKVYQLDIGTMDDGEAIVATWVSDPLTMGTAGKRKKVKNIAITMSDVNSSGEVNLYLKEGDGDYSEPYTLTIPTASPGDTIVSRVKTGKFYNLSLKLQTTAQVTIDCIDFSAKRKTKVR